jgi:hypothetical protein
MLIMPAFLLKRADHSFINLLPLPGSAKQVVCPDKVGAGFAGLFPIAI